MRVAIHAGTLRGLGSGVIGRGLVEALVGRCSGGGDDFIVWVPKAWDWSKRRLPAHIELRVVRRGVLSKFAAENIQIRRSLRRDGVDVLVSLGDTSLPASPVPHLLFVQQAFLAYHPSQWDFPTSVRFRARMRLMSAYLKLALPSVSRVVVQTHDMRRRFSRRHGFPIERIRVVPSAVGIDSVVSAAGRPPSVGPGPASTNPYVCYVASPGPHKNHDILADVMAAVGGRHPELRCRITVRPASVLRLVRRASRLGVADRFVFEGPLTRPRSLDLLRGAQALVMPSKMESFGLPYYEAMAMGCPVVTSDRPFAHEACAGAGLYADPDRGHEFAVHLGRLLDDRDFAQGQSARSRARYRELERSWASVAGDYLDLIRELGDG